MAPHSHTLDSVWMLGMPVGVGFYGSQHLNVGRPTLTLGGISGDGQDKRTWKMETLLLAGLASNLGSKAGHLPCLCSIPLLTHEPMWPSLLCHQPVKNSLYPRSPTGLAGLLLGHLEAEWLIPVTSS